jgi:hypothetical protein
MITGCKTWGFDGVVRAQYDVGSIFNEYLKYIHHWYDGKGWNLPFLVLLSDITPSHKFHTRSYNALTIINITPKNVFTILAVVLFPISLKNFLFQIHITTKLKNLQSQCCSHLTNLHKSSYRYVVTWSWGRLIFTSTLPTSIFLNMLINCYL